MIPDPAEPPLSSPQGDSRSQLLDEVVTAYLKTVEAGESADPDEWLRRYPDLAPELEAFFAGQAQLQQLMDCPAIDKGMSASDAPTLGLTEAVSANLGTVRYFGDYELLAEIARGGMGVVYKARQVSLNRIVALKMILAGNLASEADVQRFHREAEAAANLDHPNILPLYEVGVYEGQQYFSMKLVSGGSLAGQLASLKGAPRQAALLVAAVARGIHFAHQRGILHRDLKPANILLDENGIPYVTDFGLARQVDADSGLTRTGAIVGTPSYMPPEQARAERQLTTAADIYSLGAVLYECLTGQPPFRGATVVDTILEVLEREPPAPRTLAPGIDRDLETICLKCLEKDPAQRYASAQALAEDLERWQAGEPILARPVGGAERAWRWCRRNPAVAALLTACLLLLVAGSVLSTMFGLRAQRHAVLASEASRKADDERKTNARLLARFYAERGHMLLEQGDSLAALPWLVQAVKVIDDQPEERQGHRLRLGAVLAEAPRLVRVFWHAPSTFGVQHVAFSPDGRSLLSCGYDHTARLWDLETGKQRMEPLRHKDAVYHAAFSPDGKRIVTASYDQTAQVWDARTGAKIGMAMQHRDQVMKVAFSPDGRRVATVSSDRTARVWDASTGHPVTAPLAFDGTGTTIAFSPDGRLVTAGGGANARVWDAQTGVPLTPLLGHRPGVHASTFSPDGRSLLTVADDGARIWDLSTGKERVPLLQHTSLLVGCYSPDGSKIATSGYDRTIRLWEAETGKPFEPSVSFEHDATVVHLEFSGDGRFLVSAGHDGTARVWSFQETVYHSKVEPQLAFAPLRQSAGLNMATFRACGRLLATASMDGTVRVWDLRAWEASLDRLAERNLVRTVALSRDGNWALTANFEEVEVWDLTRRQQPPKILQHDERLQHVEFSPDEKRLVTVSFDHKVHLWETATGRLLRKIPHQECATVAFRGDGQQLASLDGKGLLRLWDPSTGQQSGKELRLGEGTCQRMQYSPEGRHLLLQDRPQILWDVARGTRMPLPWPKDEILEDVTFSPDGKWLLSIDQRGRVRFWDRQTGVAFGPPRECGIFGSKIAFAPDGASFLTTRAGSFEEMRLWSVPSGEPLTLPMPHPRRSSNEFLFSADSRLLFTTTSGDNRLRVWDTRSGLLLTPPLPGSGGLYGEVAVSQDGRILSTQSTGAALWRLIPEHRPSDNLLELSRLVSERELDSSGYLGQIPLDTGLYERVRQNFPERFRLPSEEDLLRWHGQQANEGEAHSRWFAAAYHLDHLLGRGTPTADLYRRRGLARAHLGRNQDSDADFAQADRRQPLSAADWQNRGEIYARNDRLQFAEVDFYQALERDNKLKRAWYERALVRARTGRLLEARADLERWWSLSGDKASLWGRYPLALLRLATGTRADYRAARPAIPPAESRETTDGEFVVWTRTLDAIDPAEEARLLALLKEGEGTFSVVVGASYPPLPVRYEINDLLTTHLRGVVLLRAGKPSQALTPLGEAAKKLTGFLAVRNRLYLALAQARAAQPTQARETLAKLRPELDKLVSHWDERLELDLLQKEINHALLALDQP